MNADDHALIDLFARLDNHRAAVFKVPHGIGNCFADIIGNQDAIGAPADIALVRLIGMEQAVHDGRAARFGQKFRLVANEAAGRGVEHKTQAVAAGRTQLDHFGLALIHALHNDARMLFIHVDDDFFHRFQQLAGFLVLLQDNARTRNGKFKAFAAHGFDENCQLQFAATGDVERILVLGFLDLQRHIAFRFTEQAVADDAAGHLVTLGTGQRRIIDDE